MACKRASQTVPMSAIPLPGTVRQDPIAATQLGRGGLVISHGCAGREINPTHVAGARRRKVAIEDEDYNI